ncbi:hypothetical protein BH11PSE9_BH11PSE9_06820 [soil metagenome]
MKTPSPRRPASLLSLICLGAALWAAAPLAAFSAERGPIRSTSAAAKAAAGTETEARVIVTFKADVANKRALSASASGSVTTTAAIPRHAQALSQRLGLKMTDGRALGELTQVVKASGITSQELVARLAAQSDVESVVVDQRRRAFSVPNDSLYAASTSISPVVGQWYLRAPDATAVAAINAEPAWDITTGSSSVVVAVLDTGVRFDHPDLASKLLPGYDFINSSGTANDGNGRDSDASDPGDYVTSADVGQNGCTSSDVGSSSWHGTHTAGLIGAATNNTLGMASVGYNVMVQPLRVLGKCGGFDSDIQAAMQYAGNITFTGSPGTNPTPAKVINLSLGGTGACSSQYQTIVNQLLAKGIVVVAAAGNDGLAVGSPGNCAGVIAVGGLRHAGTKVGYSDLGSAVTISAPAGNCVNVGTGEACLYPLLTTGNSGTTTPVAGAAGATYTTSGADASLGTSFSAPLVSGTVALMLSANPSLTPAAIKTALSSTARAFPTTSTDPTVKACVAPTSVAQSTECICTTSTCGAGMLDTGRAVAAVVPPTAAIGVVGNAAVAGTAVTLDGSASSAASGAGHTIVGYRWTIVSGTAAFSGATTGASATLLPGAAGSVVVSLVVTDSAGLSNTINKTIPVAAAPVASPATANVELASAAVVAGTPVSLNASGSVASGSGNAITTYQWAIVSGAATFQGATTGAVATVLPSVPGNVTVSLTVTDGAGSQNIANITIVASDPAVAAPTAPVTPLAQVNITSTSAVAGNSVILNGSGSQSGQTGLTITGYQWALVSGNASFSGPTNDATAILVPGAAGSVTVSLTATNSAGGQNTTSIGLTVAAAPVTPTPPAASSGGGGALNVVWLLMLLAAIAAVWRVTPVAKRVRADR